jgi:hypothetical protein
MKIRNIILETEEKIHVFEAAGLGKAPFKVVGLAILPDPSLGEHNPDAYQNALRALPKDVPVGVCRYCGTALKNNYIVQDATGRKFAVGSECVAKTGDAGMISKAKLLDKQRQQAINLQKRQEDTRKRVDAAKVKREKEESEQRIRNKGLTDAEVKQEKLNKKIGKLSSYIKILHDGRGGFRDSIADNMGRYGELPYGKAFNIMLDILAKELGGRSGSKTYWDAYEKIEKDFEDIKKEHGE